MKIKRKNTLKPWDCFLVEKNRFKFVQFWDCPLMPSVSHYFLTRELSYFVWILFGFFSYQYYIIFLQSEATARSGRYPKPKIPWEQRQKKQRWQRSSKEVFREGGVIKGGEARAVHASESQAGEGSCWSGEREDAQAISGKVEETGWQRLERETLFYLWTRGTH